MKKIVLLLITVFCMSCLVACDGVSNDSTNADDNKEIVSNSNNEPVITEAPAVEPELTPAPAETTPEPTADPVETLTSLREDALAEQVLIVELLQTRVDIIPDILEVIKGYPNFKEDATYEMVVWAQSIYEKDVLTGNINNIIEAINCINIAINDLIVEYPELKNTDEFINFVNSPQIDAAFYNGYVSIYNKALSNSTASEFEELPYCTVIETQIEY